MFLEKAVIKANWIWTRNNTEKNRWVCFRKQFQLESISNEKIMAKISAETKYYLYINQKMVVFEGSLNRGPFEKGGYADYVDITSYLKQGNNTVAVLAWFWGNEGRNNINSGAGGFVFECEFPGKHMICSDSSWKAAAYKSYGETGAPYPSYLYGGYNIGFDARDDIGDFTAENYDDSLWEYAVDYGRVPTDPWFELYKRPVPLIKAGKLKRYKKVVRQGEKLIAELPYACHLTPYFEIEAEAGQTVDIRTDHYYVNGGPGDNINVYTGHRAEYITKDGVQQFEALNWLYGEKVVYTVPKTVKVLSLKYRESGYHTSFVGDFKCENESINKLIEKCKRTLYVCMRDNFMDCPDRERGQWIGDTSVQVPQVFYTLDRNSVKLVKKGIFDFINLRKGDILLGNVPGVNFSELPSQSLISISRLGMLGKYYEFTGDREVLRLAYEPIIKYLKLWNLGADGLVEKRNGDWYWFDHLENNDEKILENELYYGALTFAQQIEKLLKKHRHKDFIEERISSIKEAFDKNFWKGDRYSSGSITDDRANALAVLCGLADECKYEQISTVLKNEFNATPYMEFFVLESLFKMGFYKQGIERMLSRYKPLIENENSTLWEDFSILGTKNHAWSGGPLSLLYKYISGITIEQDNGYSMKINPYMDGFNNISASMMSKYGMLRLEMCRKGDDVHIKLKKPARLAVAYQFEPKRLGVQSENNIIINFD